MPPVALERGDARRRRRAGRREQASRASKEGQLFMGFGELGRPHGHRRQDAVALASRTCRRRLPLSVAFGVFGLVGPDRLFRPARHRQAQGRARRWWSPPRPAASARSSGRSARSRAARSSASPAVPDKCRYHRRRARLRRGDRLQERKRWGQAARRARAGRHRHQLRAGRRPDHGFGDAPDAPSIGRMPLCGMVSGYNSTRRRAHGPSRPGR